MTWRQQPSSAFETRAEHSLGHQRLARAARTVEVGAPVPLRATGIKTRSIEHCCPPVQLENSLSIARKWCPETHELCAGNNQSAPKSRTRSNQPSKSPVAVAVRRRRRRRRSPLPSPFTVAVAVAVHRGRCRSPSPSPFTVAVHRRRCRCWLAASSTSVAMRELIPPAARARRGLGG